MNKTDRIYIAGHNGLVGSAIVNIIEKEQNNKIKANNDIMKLMSPIRSKLDENLISGEKL